MAPTPPRHRSPPPPFPPRRANAHGPRRSEEARRAARHTSPALLPPPSTHRRTAPPARPLSAPHRIRTGALIAACDEGDSPQTAIKSRAAREARPARRSLQRAGPYQPPPSRPSRRPRRLPRPQPQPQTQPPPFSADRPFPSSPPLLRSSHPIFPPRPRLFAWKRSMNRIMTAAMSFAPALPAPLRPAA